MEVKLFAQPDIKPVLWKDFLKYDRFSIALDGFVCDETKFDETRRIANFNHHEKANRLATSATCGQVKRAIDMGLIDFFRDEKNEKHINVYVNHCDEDCCLSYYLLENSHICGVSSNPILNRLVFIEDVLDSTAGAYPINKDSVILEEIAWIFEPFYRTKLNNYASMKKPDVCKGIIEDVSKRITAHLLGRGDRVKLDTAYKVIGGGKNWKMVEEIGVHAKTGMKSDGIISFVSVKQRDTNTWDYIIGKNSPFVANFNINQIYGLLNKIDSADGDLWGGADIIGGSPRIRGSKLSPDELEKAINEHLNI